MRTTLNIHETKTTYTLTQILAERATERDREQQDRKREADQWAADRATEQIEWLSGCLNDRLSQQTRDALQLTYGYHRDDDEHELEYAHARFDHEGACWEIRYFRGWDVIGPDGYRVTFEYGRYGERPFDAPILDALAGYPTWMGQKREQNTRNEGKPTIPHYRYTTGGMAGEARNGLLHIGAHVTIWMIPTDGSEYQHPHYTGRVDSYDDRWLLLTCDGTSQRQRLIPIARIDEIVPELPYEPAQTQPTQPTQPQPEQTETTYGCDICNHNWPGDRPIPSCPFCGAVGSVTEQIPF